MGAMHEVFTPMTAKDIAKKEQKDIATIRLRWNAVFAKGTFDSNRELTQDEINAISRNSKQKSMKSQRKASAKYVHNEVSETENKIVVLQPPAHPVFAKHNFDEIAPEKQPAPATAPEPEPLQKKQHLRLPSLHDVRRFTISLLLFSVVLLHGALIWYDCAVLWDVPGQIGGGAVFVVVFAALLLASDSTLPRTSGNALVFMAIVDCAAWKVHYEVFKTPIVSDAITGSLCAFICASSFVALYLFRDSKLD